MSYLGTRIRFNGNHLTSVDGLTILSHNPYATPKRKIHIGEIARTHKSKAHSGFFSERLITVRVNIVQSTRALLEQALDSLHALLQTVEGELIVEQGGADRRYYATMSDIQFLQEGGSYAELNIIFVCSDRFGYATAATTVVSLTGVTAGTRSDQYNWQGSAEWQLPIITLTYTAISGGTDKTVTLGNNANGQTLSVNRDWATSDVLIVNCFNNTVKVNGTDVDFSGAFPEFAPGTGSLAYADDFTTRTFNYNVVYYKRYV